MNKIVIAAATLSVLATTSYAADLPARMPVKAMPAPIVQSWTGCYLGAGGGYGMWNQDHRTTDAAGAVPVGASSASSTTGGRGWFGTAQFGCDYQFDQSWLIGAFVDGNWGSLRGDYIDNLGFSGRERERWSWAAGARVGYLVSPSFLAFVSAGGTEARFDSFNLTSLPAIAPGFSYARHNYSGYFIGTGYEYKLAWLPNFTWKTEYRACDFGRENVALLIGGAPTAGGFFMSSHKYEQTIRSELVWRFSSWVR